jgi:hypothetical protein
MVRATAVVVAVLMLVSCRPEIGPRPQSRSPLPPTPEFVEVTMDEYRFDYRRPVPPGRVIFTVHNEGSLDHELVLVALPERVAVPRKRRRQPQLVATVFHVRPRPPDSERKFAVDLTPGDYAMLCFIEASDGETHLDKGMRSEFRVR